MGSYLNAKYGGVPKRSPSFFCGHNTANFRGVTITTSSDRSSNNASPLNLNTAHGTIRQVPSHGSGQSASAESTGQELPRERSATHIPKHRQLTAPKPSGPSMTSTKFIIHYLRKRSGTQCLRPCRFLMVLNALDPPEAERACARAKREPVCGWAGAGGRRIPLDQPSMPRTVRSISSNWPFPLITYCSAPFCTVCNATPYCVWLLQVVGFPVACDGAWSEKEERHSQYRVREEQKYSFEPVRLRVPDD